MAKSERRASDSRVAKHLVVRYRPIEQLAWRVSTLKDLSPSGARLICEGAFDVGAIVLLQFGLPIFVKPVEVRAKVAWCKEFSGKFGLAEHGMTFVDVNEAVAKKLNEAVQKHLEAMPVVPKPPEARQQARIMRNYMVRYHKERRDPWQITTLKDFSVDGARLICEEAFEQGSELYLQFGMPLFEKPLEFVATVAWCKRTFSGTKGLAEHGVKFVVSDPTLRSLIVTAMEKILKEEDRR